MTQWNFYFSRILYAAFFEGEGELKARLLDPLSGQLGAEKIYEAEDDQFLSGLCGRSMMEFFSRKAQLEEAMAQKPEIFVTKDRRRFQNRRHEA